MSNQAKGKKTDNNSSSSNSLQQQEKLQAIVLLDSYTNAFEPLSSVQAESLTPFIGGRTLFDNNMEYLLDNEVEEIFLFCTRHHQQIRAHIDERKWRARGAEIHFMFNFKCQSLGDAMRELDAKGLVRSTFILLTATSIVSNMKLKEHLELHKQTCKADRSAIMTVMCLNKLNDLAPTSSLATANAATEQAAGAGTTLFVHNSNMRILNYEKLQPAPLALPSPSSKIQRKSEKIRVPCELIKTAYKSSSASGTKQQQQEKQQQQQSTVSKC